jgi:putative membrane protein insertion efficiency factor
MQKLADSSTSSEPEKGRANFLAYPLVFVIYLYRFSFGQFFKNSCRFYPSCSHYAEEALLKYGPIKGSIMAARRIGRCHPWHEGGYDPVL